MTANEQLVKELQKYEDELENKICSRIGNTSFCLKEFDTELEFVMLVSIEALSDLWLVQESLDVKLVFRNLKGAWKNRIGLMMLVLRRVKVRDGHHKTEESSFWSEILEVICIDFSCLREKQRRDKQCR